MSKANMLELIEQIQASIEQTAFGVTLHAQRQATARRIKIADIRTALLSEEAEVIEDYPADPRGASCLLYGIAGNKVLHVHVSYPTGDCYYYRLSTRSGAMDA